MQCFGAWFGLVSSTRSSTYCDVLDFLNTPGKFSMAPENIPSQKESILPTIIFQGRAVKLRGCIFFLVYKDDQNFSATRSVDL